MIVPWTESPFMGASADMRIFSGRMASEMAPVAVPWNGISAWPIPAASTVSVPSALPVTRASSRFTLPMKSATKRELGSS